MIKNVLITGETGTGKELAAEAIHELSERKDKKLQIINCFELKSNLSNELFGYEKGAFTGATEEKKGQLELADGGMLFLDEIHSLETKVQGALLRFLKKGEVRYVGPSGKKKTVDVRVILASNEDLEKMAEDGKVKKDFLNRIRQYEIELPPFNKRRKDVILIAEHFIEKSGEGKKYTLPDSEKDKLANLDWSDNNAHTLENIILTAVTNAVGNESMSLT